MYAWDENEKESPILVEILYRGDFHQKWETTMSMTSHFRNSFGP